MMTDDVYWRVSVATLDRVIFDRPQDGVQMLALERKATLLNERAEKRISGPDSVLVRAQPFGGAVRIHGAAALSDVVGQLRFDSQRSRDERDFRILIPPAAWAAVRQFCLRHLADPDDPILEADPSRELVEEFADAMQINLLPETYRCQSKTAYALATSRRLQWRHDLQHARQRRPAASSHRPPRSPRP